VRTLACVLVVALAPIAAPAAEGWRLVATRTFQHRVTYAGFLDVRSGLTVGGAGAGTIAVVFTTRDGGRTWLEGASAAWRRHTLEFSPEGFAWHAGMLQVSRSFDGGRTWYPAANFGDGDPSPALFLSFADENRGFIASGSQIYRTEDGGVQWLPVVLPDGVDEVAAVSTALAPPPARDNAPSLVSLHTTRSVVGRLLDRAGCLWVTTDAGASWKREESPLADKQFHLAGSAPTVALRFTRSGDGLLAAFVAQADGWRLRIFRWGAGGTGWTEEAAPALPELGTLFLSPDGRVLTWKSLERDELRVYLRG
jgi:photosystem II stability/assembly factor-like uncharacterized protein